jgi:hypothetical protein
MACFEVDVVGSSIGSNVWGLGDACLSVMTICLRKIGDWRRLVEGCIAVRLLGLRLRGRLALLVGRILGWVLRPLLVVVQLHKLGRG